MTIDISRYDDINRRLGQEAIACVPETWTQGRLTITCDGSALHYWLENDSNQTRAVATQQLGELCGELYLLMEMAGQRWSQCVVEFTKTPDDSWSFNVRFTYPD